MWATIAARSSGLYSRISQPASFNCSTKPSLRSQAVLIATLAALSAAAFVEASEAALRFAQAGAAGPGSDGAAGVPPALAPRPERVVATAGNMGRFRSGARSVPEAKVTVLPEHAQRLDRATAGAGNMGRFRRK